MKSPPLHRTGPHDAKTNASAQGQGPTRQESSPKSALAALAENSHRTVELRNLQALADNSERQRALNVYQRLANNRIPATQMETATGGKNQHPITQSTGEDLPLHGTDEDVRPQTTGRSSAPEGVVQRVRLTGETGGTEYDRGKLEPQKTTEMDKWKGLPGFQDSSDFTWHHIAPQSRLTDRGLASNPLLVRLGPSSSARIGDPGNEFTDPNVDQTGTRTPFSEDVEQTIGKDHGIDPADLTKRLGALARKPEHDANKKSLSDPSTWHIPLDVLRQHIEESPAEPASKERMHKIAQQKATLISYNKYTDKASPEREELAVPLVSLHEGAIGKDDQKLFHQAIYKRPAFVRGHVLDEFQQEKFSVQSQLIETATQKFAEQINGYEELRRLVVKAGPDLVRKKGALKKYNQMTNIMKKLVSAPEGGGVNGVEHTYYPGKNIKLDMSLWGEAMGCVRAFREKNNTDSKIKNLPEHTLKPHEDVQRVISKLGVAKQTLNEDEVAAVNKKFEYDQELEAQILKDLPQYKTRSLPKSKTAYDKTKGKVGRGEKGYPMSDTEWKDYGTFLKDGKDQDAKELSTTLKSRGSVDPNTFRVNEAKRLAEEDRKGKVLTEVSKQESKLQDIANQEKLALFQNGQDETTRQLNAAALEFVSYYRDEKTPVNVEPVFDFLMQLWPDMRMHMKDLEQHLRRGIKPAKEPSTKEDLPDYKADLTKQYSAHLETAVGKVTLDFAGYVDEKEE
jgi:hypothetical protein